MCRINLCAASLEEIQSLPGFGPVKAEAVLNYRDEYGIHSLEDLEGVHGVGFSMLYAVRDLICFNDEDEDVVPVYTPAPIDSVSATLLALALIKARFSIKWAKQAFVRLQMVLAGETSPAPKLAPLSKLQKWYQPIAGAAVMDEAIAGLGVRKAILARKMGIYDAFAIVLGLPLADLSATPLTEEMDEAVRAASMLNVARSESFFDWVHGKRAEKRAERDNEMAEVVPMIYDRYWSGPSDPRWDEWDQDHCSTSWAEAQTVRHGKVISSRWIRLDGKDGELSRPAADRVSDGIATGVYCDLVGDLTSFERMDHLDTEFATRGHERFVFDATREVSSDGYGKDDYLLYRASGTKSVAAKLKAALKAVGMKGKDAVPSDQDVSDAASNYRAYLRAWHAQAEEKGGSGAWMRSLLDVLLIVKSAMSGNPDWMDVAKAMFGQQQAQFEDMYYALEDLNDDLDTDSAWDDCLEERRESLSGFSPGRTAASKLYGKADVAAEEFDYLHRSTFCVDKEIAQVLAEMKKSHYVKQAMRLYNAFAHWTNLPFATRGQVKVVVAPLEAQLSELEDKLAYLKACESSFLSLSEQHAQRAKRVAAVKAAIRRCVKSRDVAGLKKLGASVKSSYHDVTKPWLAEVKENKVVWENADRFQKIEMAACCRLVPAAEAQRLQEALLRFQERNIRLKAEDWVRINEICGYNRIVKGLVEVVHTGYGMKVPYHLSNLGATPVVYHFATLVIGQQPQYSKEDLFGKQGLYRCISWAEVKALKCRKAWTDREGNVTEKFPEAVVAEAVEDKVEASIDAEMLADWLTSNEVTLVDAEESSEESLVLELGETAEYITRSVNVWLV